MKKILAILLALTMVLALAVPTFADTELVTKNFTISYKATYTENDWNSTPAIDKSTLTGSIVGGRAELIDVLSPILLMTDLSSITKITVVPSLSDSSDWARQSDRTGGAAGTYVAPGASLYVNSDWDSMTTDYNLNEGSDEFVVTDGFGTMSKLQFEVFGANPYSDGPITVTLEVSVTYNASSAEPNSVVISGTTYNEDVIFDSTFTADAGAWSWNAPLNGDSTPSVKSVFNLAKISPDDVYIKIIASNSTTKVMIQASPGTNGVNTPTYEITDGDNVISYYRAMDVLNAYVNGVEGASADDSFWSLVIQPVVDTVFSDLDIVRLLEVYTVTVTNGTADKGVAIEGETVTVTPNEAQSGKVFNKWIVEGLDEDDYDVDENNVLTFNMPANDVTLNATYRNLSDLSIGFDLPVIGKTPDTTLDLPEGFRAMTAQDVEGLDAAEGLLEAMGDTGMVWVKMDDQTFMSASDTFEEGVTYGLMVYLVCDEDPTGVYGSIINGRLEADQTESTVLGENYVIGGLFLDLTPIKDTSDDGIKGLSGFVVISSEYHAQIGIGGTRVIIVNEHDYNLNGDCIYCGYHTEVEEDVVEIIDPTEPSTEEEEDETVEVTPDEEPEEDENPKTGLALALVPMMIAAAVAVITKK